MNADDVVADVKSKMMGRKTRCYSEPGPRRPIRRPEEILRDVRGLKLRQRVSLVLGDEILREELEDTIRNTTVNGVTKLDTIRTYQDFLLPTYEPSISSIGGRGYGAIVLPINDIKGETSTTYNVKEKYLRCKLAAVYRLVDIKGWSEAIFNHISVRVNDVKRGEAFLVNPFGLLFSEITAASLVKCDLDGNIIDGGTTSLGVNRAGFTLHSCIHEGRQDINCIIHVHTPTAIAVSSMKCGFLRISQESLLVGDVSYHDYCGILINPEEKTSIIEDLGPKNMVMFLRNHGVVVCGKNIEETWMLLENVMYTCETQVKLTAVGLDNIHVISDAAYQQVQDFKQHSADLAMNGSAKESKSSMEVEEYYFEAYMRWLDAQGYRTGYLYHIPDIFISGNTRKQPEARIPPQMISDQPHQAYFDYHNEDPLRKGIASMGRGNTHRNRYKWLSSPVQGTQYIKDENVNIKNKQKLQPLVNGFHEEAEAEEVNHNVENSTVSFEKEKQPDGTTIITETTTVKKTNVISEEIKVKESELKKDSTKETIVNGPEEINIRDIPENHSDDIVSPTKSLNSLGSPPSENDSLDNTSESKSPQKVKKQKSFKKALMKKLHKKEDREKK